MIRKIPGTFKKRALRRKPLFAAGWVLVVIFFMGCSGKTTLTHPVSPIIRFIIPEKKRIPGKFIVVVDGKLDDLRAEVRPSTKTCGAHNFPVRVRHSFAHALANAMRFQFEDVIVLRGVPPVKDLQKMDVQGGILIGLASFRPSIACPAAGACTERTVVVLRVTAVDGKGDVLLKELARGVSEDRGGYGANCSEIASHLDHCVSDALQDAAVQVMEIVGEAAGQYWAGK